MSEVNLPPLQETYHIRVKGELDPKWEDWFDDFQIIDRQANETLLSGTVPDQAALHGLLAKVRDLGLHILLIKRIGN
jgi:hypothetical protein